MALSQEAQAAAALLATSEAKVNELKLRASNLSTSLRSGKALVADAVTKDFAGDSAGREAAEIQAARLAYAIRRNTLPPLIAAITALSGELATFDSVLEGLEGLIPEPEPGDMPETRRA